MPNWCMTNVCFKGKPENINKLKDAISNANDWGHENPMFCSVRHLLSLADFDTVSYLQRYPNYYSQPRFRGNVYDTCRPCTECEDGDILYHPVFEMAWNTDYTTMQLLSKIYGVEFSAYSVEDGMDFRHKCRNGDVDYNDYDYTIYPDMENLPEDIDEDDVYDKYDYGIPVKRGSNIEKDLLEEFKLDRITPEFREIDEADIPDIFGVYYHYIYGVAYDDEIPLSRNYPGSDPFNIYSK